MGRGNERAARAILEPLTEIGVDRGIAERAGRLRRNHGLALPDALIAATAIEAGLALITRNHRDFERVSRLRVRPEP